VDFLTQRTFPLGARKGVDEIGQGDEVDAASRLYRLDTERPDTGQIVASALTTKDVDDGALGALLDQVSPAMGHTTRERHPDAALVVAPRVTAVPSKTAATTPM
jgi:hypothetical protein